MAQRNIDEPDIDAEVVWYFELKKENWKFAHYSEAIWLASGFTIGIIRGIFTDIRVADAAMAGLLLGAVLATSVYSFLISASLVSRLFGEKTTNAGLTVAFTIWFFLSGFFGLLIFWIADLIDVVHAFPKG